MYKIDIKQFSRKYDVRKLHHDDVEMIYNFCKSNTQYYEYCGKEPSIELIERDLEITPLGLSIEQKYYVGFFDEETLVAIIDLYDGYPDEKTAYIGFFMMNKEYQGKGIGTKIIAVLLEYLKCVEFERVRLGYEKDNPQSKHFWKKNQFEDIREVSEDNVIIVVAERNLR